MSAVLRAPPKTDRKGGPGRRVGSKNLQPIKRPDYVTPQPTHTCVIEPWREQPCTFPHLVRKYLPEKYAANAEQIAMLEREIWLNERLENEARNRRP